MSPGDDEFLTTDQVLEYLHVNLKTVYRLINAGKLPAVRVGHQWRFRRRDIDAWLASNSTGTSVPAAATSTPVKSDPSSPATILVVDDDDGARNVITRALDSAQRFEVTSAPDGPSALAMLKTLQFDLLLADLRMPKMDGLTLVREARRLNPQMGVIIITAASTEASAIEAINLGVSGYILKPFRVPEIIASVDKALVGGRA